MKKFLCQILPKEIYLLSHNIITEYQVVIKLFNYPGVRRVNNSFENVFVVEIQDTQDEMTCY